MDLEGQGKLRRRDRVRKINETAKFGPDVDGVVADEEKSAQSNPVASTHYPFVIFVFILFVLLFLITSRKGGNRKMNPE